MITAKQVLRLASTNPTALTLLAKHVSPDTEVSIAKGIPVQWVEAFYGLPVRIKYRGKRRPGFAGKNTCLKADARTFAIYPR